MPPKTSAKTPLDSALLDSILQGNCIEVLQKLPESSVDVIFADPPYWMRVEGSLKRPEGGTFSGCDDKWDNAFSSNAAYSAFSREWLSECKRVLKPNGSIWVIGAMQCIYTLGGIMQDLGFWFINDVVWHKSNPTPNFMGTRLNNAHETLLWATKSKKAKYTFNYKSAKELNSDIVGFENGVRKQLGSVWKIPVCSGNERLKSDSGAKLHSTQKPLALLYRIIAISSKMGDIVLDPFGGTMTTAVAAKMLGRHYIMIEQDSAYIALGRKRVESTQFDNSDIARAELDKRPQRVSLSEMIASGYLKNGEAFYLKNSEVSASLTSEGKLLWQGKSYDIHTLCAKLKGTKAERLNGFRFWEVVRKNKRILLESIRESYRKALVL